MHMFFSLLLAHIVYGPGGIWRCNSGIGPDRSFFTGHIPQVTSTGHCCTGIKSRGLACPKPGLTF